MFDEMGGPGTPPSMPGPIPSPSFAPRQQMGGPGMPPFNMMPKMPGNMHPQAMGPNMLPNMPGPMSGGPNKVYPPNQPMIFNNTNPNAPPIYPCGICHKEVHDNDQAILCESGCNFWFHRSCTGLTEPAYTMLTHEVFAEWVCDRCFGSKNISLVKLKP